jgi:hypothetical protein
MGLMNAACEGRDVRNSAKTSIFSVLSRPPSNDGDQDIQPSDFVQGPGFQVLKKAPAPEGAGTRLQAAKRSTI